MIKNVIGIHEKKSYYRLNLMKVECSQYVFEKYSDIKFHRNCPVGTRTDSQT
jgi:hypothetical protein